MLFLRYFFSRMAHEVLIATDSRGRNIHTYMDQQTILPKHIKIHTIFRPGATINRLQSSILHHIQTHPHMQKIQSPSYIIHLIVIAVGICDLTTRTRHPKGPELCYIRTPHKIQDIITQIQTLYSQLTVMKFKVKFATIPSVSLKKHNTFHNTLNITYTIDELSTQQTQLEEDITCINNAIRHLHKPHQLRVLRWDRDLLKTKIRKSGKNITRIKKLTYNHLCDGVHPDSHLQQKWFHCMCHSVAEDMADHIDGYEFSTSSEDEDDDQAATPSWNFKRS